MGDTYYAWSNFPQYDENLNRSVIKVGDEISQDDLGVDDDEWAYLLEVGAVRKEQYPNISANQSPTEHLKDQLARAEGNTGAYVQEEEAAANEDAS